MSSLGGLSRRLAENVYLAAGRFTLADVSVAYALGFADVLGEAGCFPPAVIDYRARLAARAAYRRAYALAPSD